MSFSIRLHSIKCVEESDEWSASDEVYVLITTADLTPPPPPAPPPGSPPLPAVPVITPVPGRPVTTRIYGEWTNFDKDEILDVDNERPFWGPFEEPWEPQDIFDPDNVCIIVTVMEEDHEKMDRYRGVVQLGATTSFASSFALQRPARVARVIADIRSAIDTAEIPTQGDNHVGTQELRLDMTDLGVPLGSSKDKKLFIDGGDEGKWELVFRICHHERRVFPGGRMVAVSRSWDKMELWVVGLDNQLHGNWFHGRWHGWYALPGPTFNVDTYLAAVSRNANHMEVWGVGQDGMVHGVWFDGAKWQSWYDLPGATFKAGAPLAAVSRHPDFMEIWGVDINGVVRGKFFDDGWKPENNWFTLGGATFPSGSHLVAGSRSPFDMQVWVVDDDKPILSNRFMPDSWRGWKPLGTEIFSPGTQLAVVVRKQQVPLLPPASQFGSPTPEDQSPYVHVLAVDMGENIRDFWYEGEVERGWYQAGIQTFDQGTPIAAVSREPGSIDAWSVRQGNPDPAQNGVVYNQGVESGWLGWNQLDPRVPTAPQHIAAVSRFDGHLEVWAVLDGFVWGNVLINGTWQGWYPLRWSFVA